MTDESGAPDGLDDREQDEYVRRFRSDPAQPPQRTIVLFGLLGDSDRSGCRRIYFNRALDYYAEFRTDDVLYVETVPPDQPPLVGVEATRLTLRRDALIEFTRSRSARPLDEYDLDVRLAQRGPFQSAGAEQTVGRRHTCDVCHNTDVQHTCYCGTGLTCGQSCNVFCQTGFNTDCATCDNCTVF